MKRGALTKRKNLTLLAFLACGLLPGCGRKQASVKPVVNLYPEEETEVAVTLNYDGSLTCAYPAYDDGWTVTPEPDSVLPAQDLPAFFRDGFIVVACGGAQVS